MFQPAFGVIPDRIRHQDMPAVAERLDARRPVDMPPEHVAHDLLVQFLRDLPHIQADANLAGVVCQRFLKAQRDFHGQIRQRKDG